MPLRPHSTPTPRSAVLLAAAAATAWVATCAADGMAFPVRQGAPNFTVSYHRVKATIAGQVAHTEIDQAFRNDTSQPQEGEYVFPIPEGASVSKFSMWVEGEELEHRVLRKEEAARVYESIVRRRKDPALLEYMGRDAIRARVFPVPARVERRVTIAYDEVLTADNGTCRYLYPLAIERLSARPIREVTVTVQIEGKGPLANVYSPSHAVAVHRDGARQATASYEATGVKPDADFVLYCTLSDDDLGMTLLTHKRRSEDGYFLFLCSPNEGTARKPEPPKDVVFVLDTSGSMAGDKIDQAKAALKFCLGSLGEGDRFGVVAFSSTVDPMAQGLTRLTRAARREATDFVQALRARGGTNIGGALVTALGMFNDGARPRMVVFLTDGLPTVGETDVDAILKRVRDANRLAVRCFSFGVGHDYNAHFLDKLAESTKGYTENVFPDENVEVKVSGFYAKVSAPVLTDLTIDWGAARTYDVFPVDLPDLFRGSQLLAVGRYREATKKVALRAPAPARRPWWAMLWPLRWPFIRAAFADPEPPRTTVTKPADAVRVTGAAGGERQTFDYPASFPALSEEHSFIPRLWATRKIGYLEDQMRLNGMSDELVDEIIRLSKEHGILTEFTSFLVDIDENAPAGPRPNAISRPSSYLRENVTRLQNEARQHETGAWAANQAVNAKRNRYAQQIQRNAYRDAQGREVALNQVVNRAGKTFFQNRSQWMDAELKADQQSTVRVQAYSPAYFQLARARSDVAQYLSVAEEVVVTVNGNAIEVAKAGRSVEFSESELRELVGQVKA